MIHVLLNEFNISRVLVRSGSQLEDTGRKHGVGIKNKILTIYFLKCNSAPKFKQLDPQQPELIDYVVFC